MAATERGEDVVPLPLDVGPVRVEARVEAGFEEDPLTGGDILGDRDSDSDRRDADVGDDSHAPGIPLPTPASARSREMAAAERTA